MVMYRFVVFAGLAAALPLNINLGAYSPALVVGDGEISFGGRTDVSNLINALEGAAVNAAAGATAGAAAAPAAAAPATEAAAAPAQPEQVAAAATAGDPALSEQATQIAALQGMGKEIAPRVAADEAPAVGKRDLTGFDRALKFAEAALVKGPKVQLGTGAEGSGVGIIVDNNPTAAARPGKGAEAGAGAGAGAAEGAVAAAAKRDVVDEASAPRRRAKVTTMYVRRGVPASLQASSEELSARGPAPSAPASTKASKRSDALDAVNLNVDGDAGVTLTFVEEVDDDED